MVNEIWLVRHGQTDWNLERRYQGHSDTPLNITGIAQAELAAESLVGRDYAAIYSSDLRRARTTAEIIAQRLGMEVILDPRLREVNFGAWEGLISAEIQTRFPVEWNARMADTQHARPPGGESVQDVAERMWAALDEFTARHPGQPLIVVSHGLALATVRCRVHGASLAGAREMIPDNAQALRIEWAPLDLPLPVVG